MQKKGKGEEGEQRGADNYTQKFPYNVPFDHLPIYAFLSQDISIEQKELFSFPENALPKT